MINTEHWIKTEHAMFNPSKVIGITFEALVGDGGGPSLIVLLDGGGKIDIRGDIAIQLWGEWNNIPKPVEFSGQLNEVLKKI